MNELKVPYITVEELDHLLQAMTRDPDAVGILQSLEKSRQPLPQLALIDWMVDQGFGAWTEGLRWAVKLRRYPLLEERYQERRQWVWGKAGSGRPFDSDYPSHLLPPLVFNHLPSRLVPPEGLPLLGLQTYSPNRHHRYTATSLLRSFLALGESLTFLYHLGTVMDWKE